MGAEDVSSTVVSIMALFVFMLILLFAAGFIVVTAWRFVARGCVCNEEAPLRTPTPV
jgi:hypothetical protein